MTRDRHTQRSPSAISARSRVAASGLRAPRAPERSDWPALGARAGLNRPRIAAMRAAPTPKLTASSRNGAQGATVNRTPPSGGPASSLPPVWAAPSWLLARARRAGSRPTTAGTIAWVAFSYRVWPTPRTNASAARSGMLTRPDTMRATSTPTTAARTASTRHMTVRRSHRSTRAPVSSPTSSQGSQAAVLTTASASGSRVTVEASSGIAARCTPSPVPETSVAARSRWCPGPRRSWLSRRPRCSSARTRPRTGPGRGG